MNLLHHQRSNVSECARSFLKPARIRKSLIVVLSLTFVLSFFGVTSLPAQVPLGLPELKEPKDNPSTPGKIELGKMLFFDKRLSTDKSISCASCHDPAKGYSNGEQFATGFENQKGGRNSPTVINSAFHAFQFWDGRAATLEEQALGPIQNPVEMNMKMELALERINGIPEYSRRFQEEFGEPASDEALAKALAAFERTLLSGDAPYDRFEAGDKTAMSEAAQRGKDLFFGKANCTACHSGGNFTDNSFHNVGIGMDQEKPDEGRFAISKLGGDTGAFKTPTLREIVRTAPYMHDGSLKTLKEVVEHYNKGGIANEYLDEEIFEMNLSEQELNDLVIFLKEGLSSDSYPHVEAPELPE